MARYAEEYTAMVFRELASEMPVDQIRVGDIIDRGKINRKTFYYHFHGIGDLIEWMVDKGIESLPLSGADSVNWKDKVMLLLNSIEKNREFLSAVYISRYMPSVKKRIEDKFRRYIRTFVDNCAAAYRQKTGSPAGLTERELKYITDYYLMGVMSLLGEWLGSGCQESGSDFIEIVDNLTKNTIFNVIDAFVKSRA